MNNILKVLFVIVLAIAINTQCKAQYVVYTVKGNVSVSGKAVKAGQKLTSSTAITLLKDSRIVILAEKEKKLFTFKTPCTTTVSKIIAGTEKTTQELTDSYLAFIKNKINETDAKADKNYMQSAGSAFRETDSLAVDVLVPEEESDTIK